MTYAIQQDIIDRYDQEQLLIVAGDDDIVDAEKVTRAINDASAEIDTYLAAKYQLPLPTVPTVLVRLAVDIAMYRMASDADVATEERRQRFDDAIKLLRSMSEGKVKLGVQQTPPSSNGAVLVNSQPRRFNRGRLL